VDDVFAEVMTPLERLGARLAVVRVLEPAEAT
jgi:hypothetical protein